MSSGTSSKQLSSEGDAQFVGYGSMLMEGGLAVLVIIACGAGIGLGIQGAEGLLLFGEAAYMARYESWGAAAGLGAKVGAFVEGCANFLRALGLSPAFAVALMGVFVASFAATTLDTACRLQRYVTQELGAVLRIPALRNQHGASLFAISLAGIVAAAPYAAGWSWAEAGKGGLLLWPLFGATNQLLGGLAFLVIALWLWRRSLPVWFLALPLTFMLLLPMTAMAINIFGANGYLAKGDWMLLSFGLIIIALELWMIVEAVLVWPRAKGVLEDLDGEGNPAL